MGAVCTNLMRTTIIIFNFLLVLVGLAVMGFSVYMLLDPEMQALLIGTGSYMIFQCALYVFVGVGIVTMISALMGCCGAYHESTCLLGTYVVLLLLLALIQCGAATVSYLKREELLSDLEENLTLGTARYSSTNAGQSGEFNHMDVIEKRFFCCGGSGPDDYKDKNKPLSCCDVFNADCNMVVLRSIFNRGCNLVFRNFTEKYLNVLSVISACIGTFEVLGLLLSMMMCCSVRQEHVGYYAAAY